MECLSIVIFFLKDLFVNVYILAKAFKTVFEGIAISYIAGVIFYFFSVVLPDAKRSIPHLTACLESLRYINDYFCELSMELTGENWLNDKKDIDKIVKDIYESWDRSKTKHDKCIVHDQRFVKFYKQFNKRIDVIFANNICLSTDELKILSQIRYNKSICCIYDLDDIENIVLNENQSKLFLKNLIEVNKECRKVYGDLIKRVYKKNQ